MIARYFVDTNVLLYAASNAAPDQPKRQVARGVLRQPEIGFSAQFLQEFYASALSKKNLQMTHDAAIAVLQSLAAFPVWPLSRELVLEAIDARQRFGISYWDAAIVSAARALGCRELYTEDMTHGRELEGTTIINPFR